MRNDKVRSHIKKRRPNQRQAQSWKTDFAKT